MTWNTLVSNVLICTAFNPNFGFDVLLRSKALLLAHLTLREAIAEAEDLQQLVEENIQVDMQIDM